jgi:response regulator RpfG family c-di-GMP phosphodiesterase
MTLKLLLVGQTKSDFQSIKEAFEDEDADLIVATSIGLAIFLARKNLPHLIISQYELTDSDAHTFFCELKNEQELAKIPFVLLSTSKDQNKAPMSSASEKSMWPKNIPVLSTDEEIFLANGLALRKKILAFRAKAI